MARIIVRQASGSLHSLRVGGLDALVLGEAIMHVQEFVIAIVFVASFLAGVYVGDRLYKLHRRQSFDPLKRLRNGS
jgi:hypothetical protein